MSRDLFSVGDLLLGARPATVGLPPGQREVSAFPRYGTGGVARDPLTPWRPSIEVIGDEAGTTRLDATSLGRLPRREIVADFHCVAGWSARDLRWEGVRLRDVLASLATGVGNATHVRACGRDGFRAVLTLEDALGEDVLIADRLDGAPLPLEHGGPWRLVSPNQYGYKNAKHLCRIELHPCEPSDRHANHLTAVALGVLGTHPRARVWHEERHRHLPASSLRWVYRSLAHPVIYTGNYLGVLRGERR